MEIFQSLGRTQFVFKAAEFSAIDLCIALIHWQKHIEKNIQSDNQAEMTVLNSSLSSSVVYMGLHEKNYLNWTKILWILRAMRY